MLYQDKLMEGLALELVVPEGEYKGKYSTKIEELGKKIILIGVPFCEGQFIPLREGTSIELFFNDDVCAYSFTSQVIKRISYPIPTLIIEYPQKIKKIQRRQHVRVPVVEEIEYQVVEKEDLGPVKRGYILDLSGGGLLLKASEDLSPNTILLLNINIPGTEIEIPGTVIRSEKEESDKTYKIAIRFHEISERVRDKIIGYLFDIQRQMRQKGLV
ncbi:MAG: flagellar brake protein [Desulfitobacteriia bacterium]|jgi:c-di-GMP-binding flagellar brake protein YcgR